MPTAAFANRAIDDIHVASAANGHGIPPMAAEYYHAPAGRVARSRAVETRGRIREPGH